MIHFVKFVSIDTKSLYLSLQFRSNSKHFFLLWDHNISLSSIKKKVGHLIRVIWINDVLVIYCMFTFHCGEKLRSRNVVESDWDNVPFFDKHQLSRSKGYIRSWCNQPCQGWKPTIDLWNVEVLSQWWMLQVAIVAPITALSFQACLC